MGKDKSAPIAALRQAKIYPAGKLRLPQLVKAAIHEIGMPSRGICYGRNVRAAIHELNYIPPRGLRQFAQCGHSMFMAAIHEVECSSSRGLRLVDCGSSWIAAAAACRPGIF